MSTHTSNRWTQLAWIAFVVVVALVLWRLAVRLFEFVRERWSARGSI